MSEANLADINEREEAADSAPFDYRATMDRVSLFTGMLADMAGEIAQALNMITHVHSVAPILDPTAYRKGMGNLEDAAAILHPLHTAAVALRKARRDIAERAARKG